MKCIHVISDNENSAEVIVEKIEKLFEDKYPVTYDYAVDNTYNCRTIENYAQLGFMKIVERDVIVVDYNAKTELIKALAEFAKFNNKTVLYMSSKDLA